MDKATAIIPQDTKEETYIPIRDFYAQLSQQQSPYQCKFSFAPLFEKMKGDKFGNGIGLPK